MEGFAPELTRQRPRPSPKSHKAATEPVSVEARAAAREALRGLGVWCGLRGLHFATSGGRAWRGDRKSRRETFHAPERNGDEVARAAADSSGSRLPCFTSRTSEASVACAVPSSLQRNGAALLPKTDFRITVLKFSAPDSRNKPDAAL